MYSELHSSVHYPATALEAAGTRGQKRAFFCTSNGSHHHVRRVNRMNEVGGKRRLLPRL